MLRVNLENQTSDQLNFTYQNEKEGLIEPFEIAEGIVIPPGDYSFDQASVGVSTGPHRLAVTTLSYGTGDFYDGEREIATADLGGMRRASFRESVEI